MKLYAILVGAALTASLAHAQTYLCPDGSFITRNSQAPTITVTIDGKTETCSLTSSNPGPGTCSVSSSPKSCVGTIIGEGDCTTEFNEFGKCMTDITSNKLGADGNPICGCGVGE